MRILAFGTYQAADHPRVAVLLDGLRESGHRVVEANAPLGLATRDRVAMLGARSGAVRFAARLASAWVRLVGQGLRARRGGGPDAVLVGYMGHFDVWLARLLFPRTTIVLDHLIFAATTAQDRGFSGGFLQRMLRLLDVAALRIADVVVVDTEEHRLLVSESLRAKAVVVAVGATPSWFDAASGAADAASAVDAASGTGAAGAADPSSADASAVDAASGPGSPSGHPEALRVVFFGLFTPLQGAETIGRAIGMLPPEAPLTVTMIGNGQDLDASRAAAEGGAPVVWVPWVDAADLPGVVARHDIGLGIFGTTSKAQKVVPNKVYQCAAAGTAVVTSDTAPQRRAFGDAVEYVPAGDAEELAAVLLRLAADRELLAARRAAARAAAAQFRPGALIAPLDAVLRARAPSRARARARPRPRPVRCQKSSRRLPAADDF